MLLALPGSNGSLFLRISVTNTKAFISSVSLTLDAWTLTPTMGTEVQPWALQTWAPDAGEWQAP
jgi:hypothetical protein